MIQGKRKKFIVKALVVVAGIGLILTTFIPFIPYILEAF